MLPIYVSYFAGGENSNIKKTLKNAIGFVTGFTIVFVAMGALAGTIGGVLIKYQTVVNVVTGLIVIFFGMNFIGVIKINLFSGAKGGMPKKDLGFFSSMLFGIVFSISWTPCVGAFLGSALMLASQQGKVLVGMIMLLVYSLGLGIPFIFSAILIDKLRNTFNFIKRNYKVVNVVCGVLLIAVGVLMMTGMMNKLVVFLS